MISLIEIFKIFRKDYKPKEEEFKETWSSFWHKSERLPKTQVLGLNDDLNLLNKNKADKAALDKKADKTELANLAAGIIYKDEIVCPTINDLKNIQAEKNWGVYVDSEACYYQYDGANWGKTPFDRSQKKVVEDIITINDFLPNANIGIINYSMGADGFNIDFVNRKFIKKTGRFSISYGTLPFKMLHHPSTDLGTEEYETAFVGSADSPVVVWYLIFKVADHRIYVYHYGSVPNMFDENGILIYVPLGTFSFVNGKFTTTVKANLCYNGVLYNYANQSKEVSYFREDILGFSFYNQKTPIKIDTKTKKVSVLGCRMFLTTDSTSYGDYTIDTHETDFIGTASNSRLCYFVFDSRDKQFYLIDYGSINTTNYPLDVRNKIFVLGRGQLGDLPNSFISRGALKINGIEYSPLRSEITSISKDVCDFVIKTKTANLYDYAQKVAGYYTSLANFQNGVVSGSTTFHMSQPMPVIVGETYKRVNTPASYWWYLYDLDGNPKDILKDASYAEYTIPEGIGFVAIIVSPDADTCMFTLKNVDTSSFIKPMIYELDKTIEVEGAGSSSSNNVQLTYYGKSYLGNLPIPNMASFDYILDWLYSQSLGMGWESPRAITTEAIDGNYMWGNNVLTKYNTGTGLNPLVATIWANGGEQPIVSSVNSFSQLWHRYVNTKQNFIAASGGHGGQSIEKLSKSCTNGTTQGNNLYHTTFLNPMKAIKAAVDAQGKTICCPSITFMQGEYNYVALAGAGLTSGTDATNDKDTYKALWLQWKNDAQADVMDTLGQKEKPLILIYQVAGSYVNRLDMSINMALLEIAQENEDVLLLNPTYFTPDYGGGHLSTNGYRWYGESSAKTKFEVFVKGEKAKPVYAEKVVVTGNQVLIDHYVPVPPLVFDTWTKESITNYGYRVLQNNADVSIQSVKIEGNRVVITCNKSLEGTIEVVYAGQGRSGSGNLRDSDAFRSLYTYFDDSADAKKENYTPLDKPGGSKIYGNPYPLQNWCVAFYKKIVI